MSLLYQLADTCNLRGKIRNMFRGDAINNTEHRAALHTALRMPRDERVIFDDKNIVNDRS